MRPPTSQPLSSWSYSKKKVNKSVNTFSVEVHLGMQAWKVKKTTKERYEFTRSFFYSIFTTTRVLAHSFSSASRLWLGAAKKKNPGRLKSIIHLFPSCSIYAPIARITRKATRWKRHQKYAGCWSCQPTLDDVIHPRLGLLGACKSRHFLQSWMTDKRDHWSPYGSRAKFRWKGLVTLCNAIVHLHDFFFCVSFFKKCFDTFDLQGLHLVYVFDYVTLCSISF